MPEPRKLRVFLCHASQDKPVVRELYQRLLLESWIDPWLDKEKLLPGQEWELEIEKSVENSGAIVVCLSRSSILKEGYFQKEIKKILDLSMEKPEGTIFIIPIRLDDCQPPHQFMRWQYVDYFPKNIREQAIMQLLQALDIRRKSLEVTQISSENDFLDGNDPAEMDRKKKMRITRDYYKKGYSETRMGHDGRMTGSGQNENEASKYSNYLLINERDILRQLLIIQSKKFIWKENDKKNSLQTELVKELPSWIRGTIWRAVALIFVTLSFYMLFLYIEKSISFIYVILVPFLFLSLSLMGSGYLYRKLIDPELNYRIKLQEDKIKALSE